MNKNLHWMQHENPGEGWPEWTCPVYMKKESCPQSDIK